MKVILFWILFLPLGLFLIIFGGLTHLMLYLFEKYDNFLDWYENWSFGYSKDGWTSIGGGLYKHTGEDDESSIHKK